jgi:hypothetical protein
VDRGRALSFLDLGTRRGWVISTTPRPLYPGKTRYPLYRRLGGPQGRSGRVLKNLAPTGIRSPDRSARSQSLYRLSYPAHHQEVPSCIYSNWYTQSVYASCLLAGSGWKSSTPILLAASRHNPMPYSNCCIYRIVPPDDKQ